MSVDKITETTSNKKCVIVGNVIVSPLFLYLCMLNVLPIKKNFKQRLISLDSNFVMDCTIV